MATYDEQILGAKEQALTAKKLRESMKSPEAQMVSGWYVAPSVTQHLAELLKGYKEKQSEAEANAKIKELQSQKEKALSDWMASMPKDQAERQVPVYDGGTNQLVADALRGGSTAEMPLPRQTGTQTIPAQVATPEDRMAWILKGNTIDPNSAALGAKYLEMEPAREAAQQAKKDQMAWQAQQNELNRQNQQIGWNISAASKQSQTGEGKPLPPAALKIQTEALDKIGTGSSINADLGAIKQQIDSGRLNLSMVGNAINKARNAVGMSNEESQMLASFQSTLEKMRNDSLRLNKGVQTEGDSQRAWNELIANINDPKVVSNRIAEIQKINERGAALQQMIIDQVRANYGHNPLDTSGYQTMQPAVGQGGGSPSNVIKYDAKGNRI